MMMRIFIIFVRKITVNSNTAGFDLLVCNATTIKNLHSIVTKLYKFASFSFAPHGALLMLSMFRSRGY